jgi:hypothetical protein
METKEKKTSHFRDRVRACAIADKKKTTNLNDAIRFNIGLYLSDKLAGYAEILFDSLAIGGQREKRLKTFKIFIANLLSQTRKPIRISLNANSWTITKYNKIIGHATIKDLPKLFEENKLITMNPGFYTEKEKRETRIKATRELLKLFPEYKSGVFSKPTQLVILKDENGKLIDYPDSEPEPYRIRAILELVNKVNREAEIKQLGYKLNTNLVAIFRERFEWYGRLHSKGYSHYQGLSGNERKEITINGDRTVELDFCSLHPYLLYAAERKPYLGDPYTIDDDRKIVRDFFKVILLAMVNAENRTKAESAANNWLFKNHTERKQLKEIGITRARPMMEKFIEAHQPIAHYFFKGKITGMKIMNKDSKIALDVLNHFGKQKIPILCIHDSFIVQEQYRDELENVMKRVYKKHTKGFRIMVDQK